MVTLCISSVTACPCKVGQWVSGAEVLMDLGAWELHSTWDTFLEQPLVNGFTPPLNFPVTCRDVQEDMTLTSVKK